MSNTTVSSPKKSQVRSTPAKWDEEKTKLLLQLFAEEIDCGNRPSGVYSKHAWLNIVTKFNAKTGLGYNKEQLKNRQDNLRREFNKWETLIGKETGLGWDHQKRTLAAPDEWWAEKAKVDPAILRYKDGGPIHLDLLQKVFGGTTANGFHAYIPLNSDAVMGSEVHLDNMESENPLVDAIDDNMLNNEGFDKANETEPTTTIHGSASKLRARKCQRDSSGRRLNVSDQLTQTVGSLNDTIRENLVVYKWVRAEEETLTYTAALCPKWVWELWHGHERRFFQNMRMRKPALSNLIQSLVSIDGLHSTPKYVPLEESLAIFLLVVGQGVSYPIVEERLQRSSKTVSNHFHMVLNAVCKFGLFMVRPTSTTFEWEPEHLVNNPLAWPYFRGCVGAIDGTHIGLHVPDGQKVPWINRKGVVTTNVLAVCDFNMCITFAMVGMEGSMHDSRVLSESMRHPQMNFPIPPENMFYLADSGYPLMPGFLTPYKQTRYHLPEY